MLASLTLELGLVVALRLGVVNKETKGYELEKVRQIDMRKGKGVSVNFLCLFVNNFRWKNCNQCSCFNLVYPLAATNLAPL